MLKIRFFVVCYNCVPWYNHVYFVFFHRSWYKKRQGKETGTGQRRTWSWMVIHDKLRPAPCIIRVLWHRNASGWHHTCKLLLA